jgi:mRNA interferase YafQ
MNKLLFTNEFKKEIKLAKKRGKDLSKIIRVIQMLEKDENLPEKYRNHKLNGEFKNRWELHIEPDWLLIYKKGNGEIILERTGSHADLFE